MFFLLCNFLCCADLMDRITTHTASLQSQARLQQERIEFANFPQCLKDKTPYKPHLFFTLYNGAALVSLQALYEEEIDIGAGLMMYPPAESTIVETITQGDWTIYYNALFAWVFLNSA